jgi:hypothetical protein
MCEPVPGQALRGDGHFKTATLADTLDLSLTRHT